MAKSKAGLNTAQCPYCKEWINPQASKCPHCQSEFTPSDLEKMKSERKGMFVALGVMAAALVLFLGFCSNGSNEPIPTPTSSTSQATPKVEAASAAEIELAKQEARQMFDITPLPKGVDSPPVTGSCSDAMCATAQVQFAEADWPAAWLGDYGAQRNVAYCLITGCEGAVQIDKSAGCAWRAVILEMNSDEAGDGDAANMETECADLSPVQRQLAISKAEKIAAKVQSLSR